MTVAIGLRFHSPVPRVATWWVTGLTDIGMLTVSKKMIREGGPDKCDVCGDKDLRDEDPVYDEGYLSEFYRRCRGCNRVAGYWVQGFWESENG